MDRVDFEAIRHRVKLLEDTGDSRVFENRDGVQCPVCGRPFEEVLTSERPSEQLEPRDGLTLCIRNGDRYVSLYTHAGDS